MNKRLYLNVQAKGWAFRCLEETHSFPSDRGGGEKSRRRDRGRLPQLETRRWGRQWTVQAWVHAFQSIFTCSGDESPLQPLELAKSEIDARGCPGDAAGGSLVGSVWVTGGWGRGAAPPQTRLEAGSGVGRADHEGLVLTPLSATRFRSLGALKGRHHVAGRERGSVVPECAASGLSA